MKFLNLCRDYNIQQSSEEHKHSRSGWINVRCPMCSGHEGHHLGFNLEKEYFRCWRCGPHEHIEIIEKLLNTSKSEAYSILKKYGGRSRNIKKQVQKKRVKQLKFPPGTKKLSERHKKYLQGRDFDPDKLEKKWGLMGTGPTGPYKHRIIIPIYHKKQLVSFQGRGITNKTTLKYKACSADEEVMNHQNTLYGLDLVTNDKVIVVEGVTDVWRFGPDSVCTFGIEFTMAQISLLKKFNKVFIIFDPEKQAAKQAKKMANLLSAFCNVEIISGLSTDPGSLPQPIADSIKRSLLS